MLDLHLHTNMSDGSDTPSQLVQKVKSLGLAYFSITDHDDIRANQIATELVGKDKNAPKFITGCEISSVFEGMNIHLLCYGFNLEAKCIGDMISRGSFLRRQRVTAIFEHLKVKHNIDLPQADKADILSRKIPGKVHITDAIQKYHDLDRQDIFDNYLDDMESRQFKIKASEVISMVGEGGGVVSLAHPIEIQREYKIDFDQLQQIVKKLKDCGLCAVEVYHSKHSKSDIDRYKEIVNQNNLLVSGGSDYHGSNKSVSICQLSCCGYSPNDSEITLLSCF